MPLAIIGIGLHDEKDITLRGLDLVKHADRVYMDTYTSVLSCSVTQLEKLYGKQVIPADRDLVESKAEATILQDAKEQNVAFLVVGDPLCATTHQDLVLRARHMGIPVTIVPNSSILTAIAVTGLQIYKFGKTASIPFHAKDVPINSPLQTLTENLSVKAHTLFLLDLDPGSGKFLTIPEAIELLVDSAKRIGSQTFTPENLCVGCAQLGSNEPLILAGSAKDLADRDFGPPPHCFIVPGPLHFIEEEAVKMWSVEGHPLKRPTDAKR